MHSAKCQVRKEVHAQKQQQTEAGPCAVGSHAGCVSMLPSPMELWAARVIGMGTLHAGYSTRRLRPAGCCCLNCKDMLWKGQTKAIGLLATRETDATARQLAASSCLQGKQGHEQQCSVAPQTPAMTERNPVVPCPRLGPVNHRGTWLPCTCTALAASQTHNIPS